MGVRDSYGVRVSFLGGLTGTIDAMDGLEEEFRTVDSMLIVQKSGDHQVDVGSLSDLLKGSLHSRWLFGMSSIGSVNMYQLWILVFWCPCLALLCN